MKNTFGDNITITLFGESHGSAIGAVIDGIAPGITVDEEKIAYKLLLRRPSGGISTQRVEADKFSIVSGVYNGKTTGTPTKTRKAETIRKQKTLQDLLMQIIPPI